MLSAWLNNTVKIQRRANPAARNAFNEPDYGAESTWPIVYANLNVRIEFEPEIMDFTQTGERVNPSAMKTFMYVEPENTIKPEDRITVLTSDDQTIVGKLYIAVAVFGEWNSVGNTHHFIVQLQVH